MNCTRVRINVYSIKCTALAERFQLNKNVFFRTLVAKFVFKLYFRFRKYTIVYNAYTVHSIESSNVRTIVFIAATVTFILSLYQ